MGAMPKIQKLESSRQRCKLVLYIGIHLAGVVYLGLFLTWSLVKTFRDYRVESSINREF